MAGEIGAGLFLAVAPNAFAFADAFADSCAVEALLWGRQDGGGGGTGEDFDYGIVFEFRERLGLGDGDRGGRLSAGTISMWF